MEQNLHSIKDPKYPGAEYFFQAIEMERNEEASSELDLDADFFSWKVVKRRQKPQRRYTVSHAAPPAPPSTPTSLSKEHDPLSELSVSMWPNEHSGIENCNSHANAPENDKCRLGSLLYILDYAAKYKKKLKEQHRNDTELAELFKVITITGGSSSGRSSVCGNLSADNGESLSKPSMEHGVSITSRKIRKPDMKSGVFRIHRNPDDNRMLRDLHDEDSLSAPEFDAASEENMTVAPPWRRLKVCKRRKFRTYPRERFLREFEIMKRMNEVVDTFDSTMSFQSAQ